MTIEPAVTAAARRFDAALVEHLASIAPEETARLLWLAQARLEAEGRPGQLRNLASHRGRATLAGTVATIYSDVLAGRRGSWDTLMAWQHAVEDAGIALDWSAILGLASKTA